MNARHPSRNKLIVVCGLSFAGKTTLGDAICAEFGYPQVDVDETKVDLYGPEIVDEDLDGEQWTEMYRQTDNRIAGYLRDGSSVADASRNFRKEERDGARVLAKGAGADVVVVYVNAPEWLVRQRWAENRANQTRRDVSDKDFEEIIAVMEPPADDETPLVFRHDEDIKTWLAENTGSLAGE